MQDVAKKVSYLRWYVETVYRVATSIQDDHLARIYARAFFIGLDAFLHYAPAFKNQLHREGHLSVAAKEDLKRRIAVLNASYRGVYENVRDKFGAHVQALTTDTPSGTQYALGDVLESWNAIDVTSLTILRDDVVQVWLPFQGALPASAFVKRPAEVARRGALNVPRDIRCTFSRVDGFATGVDRVAATRPNTAMLVSCHPIQEKGYRLVTIFDSMRQHWMSGLFHATHRASHLAYKASVDLLIVDLCSALDNIFEDSPESRNGPALLTLLSPTEAKPLRAFRRKPLLEVAIRSFRNAFSAHVDDDAMLSDLEDLYRALPLQEIHEYRVDLNAAFWDGVRDTIGLTGCLAHGHVQEGVVGSPFPTPSQKSFR